jgi:hypothetical protein
LPGPVHDDPGAAAWRVEDRDLAAVGPGDAVDEVEAEAGAAAGAVAGPELGEHAPAHLEWDALALVVDGEADAVGGPALVEPRFGLDAHRTAAVADGVLDDVGDDLGELVGVDVDLGQLGRRLELDVVGGTGLDVRDDPLEQDTYVGAAPGQAEPPGVETRHVEELGDQPAEPVGVRVDGGQHQQLLLVVEPGPAAQHRLDETLDAGQRRPQLVGHGGDQVRAFAVEAGAAAARADGDGHARGRSQRLVAPDPRRDQALVAVGQHPRLLRDTGAGARPLERRVVLQPRAPVVAGQGEHVDELGSDHLRAVHAEQLLRGPVDQHHRLVAVEDDDAVGQYVDRLARLPHHVPHVTSTGSSPALSCAW